MAAKFHRWNALPDFQIVGDPRRCAQNGAGAAETEFPLRVYANALVSRQDFNPGPSKGVSVVK